MQKCSKLFHIDDMQPNQGFTVLYHLFKRLYRLSNLEDTVGVKGEKLKQIHYTSKHTRYYHKAVKLLKYIFYISLRPLVDLKYNLVNRQFITTPK